MCEFNPKPNPYIISKIRSKQQITVFHIFACINFTYHLGVMMKLLRTCVSNSNRPIGMYWISFEIQ